MPRDLSLLTVSLVIWGVGEGLFFYFQPLYLEQLGADPVLIGLLLGAYGVAMTITHVPAGYLADRFGRKPLMMAAWLTGTVAAWIMALSNSLSWFVVGMLLYGLTLFVSAPLNSYITAGRGRFRVEQAITIVIAGFYLGAIIGPFLGGRIGERLGLETTYLVAACLFVISTLVFIFVRPQPVERQAAASKPPSLFRNRDYILFLGVVFLAMYAMFLPQPLTPNFLESTVGLNLEQIGWLFSISGLGIVVLSLVLGQLPVRIGFILCQICVGTFSLLLWQGSGLPAYMIGFFLLGGYRVARSLAPAQVRSMVTSSQMGLAYGWTDTIGTSATILSPPLAGYLFNLDPRIVFPLGLGLSAVVIVLNIVFNQFTRKRPRDKYIDDSLEALAK